MAVLDILKFGSPVLRTEASSVEEISDKTKQLISDMQDTMKACEGVGLAAPQVGILKRIIVFVDEEGNIRTLINPRIIKKHGSSTDNEGCLSIPGRTGTVSRAFSVEVEALDLKGSKIKLQRNGLTARILQHEIDHLDGILFIDHADSVQSIKED